MQRPSEDSLRRARATLRSIATDAPSHLPSLNLIADALQRQLDACGQVALLYIHLERYGKFESRFGWRIVGDVLEAVAASLTSMTGSTLRELDVVSDFTLTDDAFVVLLSPPRKVETMSEDDVVGVMRRVQARLQTLLLNDLTTGIFDRVHPTVGAAVVSADETLTFEQSLEQGVAMAMEAAHEQQVSHFAELERVLGEALAHDELEPLYEPLVDPEARVVVGYRSAVRGPFHSPLRLPDVLLDVAQRSSLLSSYGVAARKAAVKAAEGLHPDHLLFLECAPAELPNAAIVAVSEFYSLNPSLVPQHAVFELACDDLRANVASTLRTLADVREMGFQLGISGLGMQCLDLDVIAEIHPDYLRLDPGVVSDIDTNPNSIEIVQLLVRFGIRVGAQVIASGVRDLEQERALVRSGVDLFCGELYARPDTRLPAVSFTR